ncbi:MAG: class II histone deacetylase [Candidatus Heimdallarchaeota archaeon]|nr:class II histone deacetylase [Candidatus Heimdallarchaeota archaeon]
MITLIDHEDYYKHKMPNIRESPQRLEIILNAIRKQKLVEKKQVQIRSPELASEEAILSLHSNSLLSIIKTSCEIGGAAITSDTIANEHTFQAARRAVGGAILAGEIAVQKQGSVAYALTRPPGHHATRNRAMGFCFFNNIALAVHHLLMERKAKRIAIIDYDNHYGNGTAELFYNRNDVLYISLHADPSFCFPYSGRAEEIGEGKGKGYNVCIPLPVKTGDKQYLKAIDQIVFPIVEEYEPDLLFISAGYDSLDEDPYGFLGLTIHGYQKIGERIIALARAVCNGKVALTLEGGYKFRELGEAFIANISPFLPDYPTKSTTEPHNLSSSLSPKQFDRAMARVKKCLRTFWTID